MYKSKTVFKMTSNPRWHKLAGQPKDQSGWSVGRPLSSNNIRVATRLVDKNSLTFPWHFPDYKHKFQSLSRYITCGDFSQYIQNHIEFTLFINRCFNIVVLKIGQHKRTLSTPWKLSVFCVEHYANMKINKIWKKSFGKWYLNEDIIQDFSPIWNIIHQTMKNMHR